MHMSVETNKIVKDIMCDNSTRIDYNYKIGYKVMVRKNQAYKYETAFQGVYEIIQTWTNGTFTIKR